MDKQDKTAEGKVIPLHEHNAEITSIEINGEKWVKGSYALHLQNGVDVGQEMVDEYKAQVAELEAKIKALEEQLEATQDTEADGIVFCGKCGKIK